MDKVAKAWVDGSYNSKLDIYGSGSIIILPNGKELTILKSNSNNLSKYRNVTGEVLASLYTIYQCITLQMDKVVIYYDYKGIENWATGEWKANNELTQTYVNAINKYKEHINIAFVKVKGHSGDHYNEIADSLAKKSIENYIKENGL